MLLFTYAVVMIIDNFRQCKIWTFKIIEDYRVFRNLSKRFFQKFSLAWSSSLENQVGRSTLGSKIAPAGIEMNEIVLPINVIAKHQWRKHHRIIGKRGKFTSDKIVCDQFFKRGRINDNFNVAEVGLYRLAKTYLARKQKKSDDY